MSEQTAAQPATQSAFTEPSLEDLRRQFIGQKIGVTESCRFFGLLPSFSVPSTDGTITRLEYATRYNVNVVTPTDRMPFGAMGKIGYDPKRLNVRVSRDGAKGYYISDLCIG